MHRQILIALILGAFLPGTVHADSLPYTSPGPDAAMIVGAPGKAARNLYPVEFIAIDDVNIGNREVMWLEPGHYTLTVRAFVRNPPGMQFRSKRRGQGHNRIELVVEPGRTYHVLARLNKERQGAAFTTVLYRVSETGR